MHVSRNSWINNVRAVRHRSTSKALLTPSMAALSNVGCGVSIRPYTCSRHMYIYIYMICIYIYTSGRDNSKRHASMPGDAASHVGTSRAAAIATGI